ncbi:dihydroxy-acid dehydratase [Striga asiatica]|uniref:Dihydroxy-acid dehydratase n=1 Tax=Striga asiatica TaxID=4170 RepID=A0A5A7PR29_STRAF|nr:dihydroxy-acid dehydratase [Striga asiatica]
MKAPKAFLHDIFSHPFALIGLGCYTLVLFAYTKLWGLFRWEIPRKVRVVVETVMINLSIFLSTVLNDEWSLAIVFAATMHLVCLCNLAVVVDSIGLYDTLLSSFGAGVFTQADKKFSTSVAIAMSSAFTSPCSWHFHQFQRECSDAEKVHGVFEAVEKPVENALGAAKSAAKATKDAAVAAEDNLKAAGEASGSARGVKALAAAVALEEAMMAESAMKVAAAA